MRDMRNIIHFTRNLKGGGKSPTGAGICSQQHRDFFFMSKKMREVGKDSTISGRSSWECHKLGPPKSRGTRCLQTHNELAFHS